MSFLITACPAAGDGDTATTGSGGEGTTVYGSATETSTQTTSTTASTTTSTGMTAAETTAPTSSETDTGEPATCEDRVKDGDETDVDCGGSCPSCPEGSACVVPTDCESGVCVDGLCVAPICTDDDDCGGGDACSEPVCDLETMTCALAPLADQTPCDDGLLCTPMSGSCQGGECVTGSIAPISLGVPLPAGAGFIIDGEVADGKAGYLVEGIGDVNGDGLDDLAVGISDSSAFPAEERGRNYIVFGKADDAAVDLADVREGVGGFYIRPAAGELLSAYIKGVGDVNQDGLADLVVAHPGGYNLDKTILGSGRVYVVLGKQDTEAVSLDDIQAGIGGFAVFGESAGGLGYALGAAGDVDGDGRDDVLMGEPLFPKQSQEGRVLVVFGGDAQPLRMASTIAEGQGGFAIVGAAPGHHVGVGTNSLGAAGDVDGDGHADLLIGNVGYPGPNDEAGRLYFVRGKAGGAPIELADVAAGSGGYVIGGTAPHGVLGMSVADLGDINDDGIRDFLVSAPYWSVNAEEPGRVYVVYGKLDGAAVDVAELEAGIGGYAVTSEVIFDGFGYVTKALGDLDGDGRSDFGIGAIATHYTKINAGRASVVFSPSMPAASIPAAVLADGDGGFVIDGANAGDGAYIIGGVGDINGDGIPDVTIGAHGVDDKIKNAGRVYVLFGPLCALP